MQRRIVGLFDVDGTTSDSFGHNHRTTIRAHCHFNLRAPELSELRGKYDQSDGFRKLLRSIGVPDNKMSAYGAYWWKTYCDLIAEDPPLMVPGAKEAVEHFASNAPAMLLSKAIEKNVNWQLGIAWVRSVFKEVILVDLSMDKTTAMANLKARMNGDSLIYFGDTLSDGESCLAAGIKFGAMIHSHSYNEERILLEFVKAHPGSAVAVNGVTDFLRAAEDAFR
jgi:phosphoglycolate phosphatase-like HAD superfamily hydrolase